MPKGAKNAAETPSPALSLQDWALLFMLAALWGGAFFLTEIALFAFPPLTLVALRVVFGAVALWIVALAGGVAPPRGLCAWAALALLGVVNVAAPFWLIAYGQTQIDAGLASVLNATTPIFAVVIASMLLSDERITALRFAGVLIGLCGAALVIGLDALLHWRTASTIGQFAVIGAAMAYGFGAVLARGLGRLRLSPFQIALGQLTTAGALLATAAIAIDRPFSAEGAASFAALSEAALLSGWIASIAQGVASTALAYLIYFRVIASAGAGNGALATFLIPPVAILLSAVFLDGRLEAADYLGMATIGLGLTLIDGRLWRRRRR